MKTIKVLQLCNGKEPFHEWLDKLDKRTQAKIHTFIDRLASGGGKKNLKAIGNGVFEIKINFGPGYRVYFGEDGKFIILLLLGGDKSRQNTDIKVAQEYWRQYVSK